MDLKYYIYVSDSKIDMLFGQIPEGLLSGLISELKINFGVVSASLSRDSPDAARFSKLSVVRRYIEKHAEVGTIDAPKEYFSATIGAKWGRLFHPYRSTEIVYFGGKTKRTTFGLGGSLSHVIGSSVDGKTELGSSAPFLLRALSQVDTKIAGETDDSWYNEISNYDDVRDAVLLANERLTGPKQKLEFLAKRLLVEPPSISHEENGKILLGSPIYVALVE